jgi:autotransporter-associated beta strand protein
MAISDTTISAWNDPITSTPSIIQTGFGAYGQDLPGDGLEYCGPTSVVMGLYWLSSNGFTQLASQTYHKSEAENLVTVVAGLMNTSADGGTGLTGLQDGVADYFAARGIGTNLYQLNPNADRDFNGFAEELSPNLQPNANTIVMAVFGVAWCTPVQGHPNELVHHGGHFLTPLAVSFGPDMLVLNNAFPASFQKVPNVAESNPQTVEIVALPSNYQLTPPPSPPYNEVITPILGVDLFAILGSFLVWTLDAAARPDTDGYAPAQWLINGQKTINVNTDGVLEVLAPIADGRTPGGLLTAGSGTLLLTNTNGLSGPTTVMAGVLASSQTTGWPFGTGPIVLSGGYGLSLQPDANTTVQINLPDLTSGVGGGSLILEGVNAYTVTIASISVPFAGGSLILVPGAGVQDLGPKGSEHVFVTGQAQQPLVPYAVGEFDDLTGIGKFLAFSSDGEFMPAEVNDGPIGNVGPTDIYQASGEQVIDASKHRTLSMAALEIIGTISSTGASLPVVVVGPDSTTAQVILNGGTINDAALNFGQQGQSPGLVYTSASNGWINGPVNGGGLTVLGPGTLVLGYDNAATLRGDVHINAGTLMSASPQGSGAGSGNVYIHFDGTLVVQDQCAAPQVLVDQYGCLCLDGGTAAGEVNIAATGGVNSEPGGTLQGRGTVGAPGTTATVGGMITSGQQPGVQTGVLTFAGIAQLSGSNFFWQPQKLTDDFTTPGEYWNVLAFTTAGSAAGTSERPMRIFVDFSQVGGDPDQEDNPFWNDSHSWPVMTGTDNLTSFYAKKGNFHYQRGSFTVSPIETQIVLVWTPAQSPQSWAQQQLARAQTPDTCLPQPTIEVVPPPS